MHSAEIAAAEIVHPYKTSFAGMLEVTKVRFRNELLARALASTGNSLLLCVDSARKSRYGVGTEGGQNLQGIALMLTRDVLTGSLTWHNFLKEMGFSFDGGFFAESGWSHMMRQAHNAIAAVNYSGRTVYDNLSPFFYRALFLRAPNPQDSHDSGHMKREWSSNSLPIFFTRSLFYGLFFFGVVKSSIKINYW